MLAVEETSHHAVMKLIPVLMEITWKYSGGKEMKPPAKSKNQQPDK